SVAVVVQIVAALEYAHRPRLVHCDVKPSNILLRPDGRALLSDFGVAKISDLTRVTMTGSVLGSVDYMPPEQVEGRGGDGRADVYSLGVVLYELLAGHVPFVGNTP